MAKSQLLLNLLRWCFKLHGSIDPIESVKLPSVNYFWQIQDGVPLLYMLRYNIYCISIVNTNQAQLMIVYKASNVCILLTFVSAIP